MNGDSSAIIAQKTQEMKKKAALEEYEQAARLRDTISALKHVNERNTVVLDRTIDADIFAIAHDELEASIQVFYVRAGRIRAQHGWITEGLSTDDPSQLLREALMHVYSDALYDDIHDTYEREESRSIDDYEHTPVHAIPKEIWLPHLPADEKELEEWISTKRGKQAHFYIPMRGNKAQLLHTVQANAIQVLQRYKIEKNSDITSRSQAIEELRDVLELSRAPLRIECFDISHTQGQQPVASMVVFDDGLPQKKHYRHFIVRSRNDEGTIDDTAAMDEVLRRRFSYLSTHVIDDVDTSTEESKKRNMSTDSDTASDNMSDQSFYQIPDLLIVDGGLPQVHAAMRVARDMNITIPIIGLAKRLEEVWVEGQDFPIIFPRSSPALRLLQYVRDESHRFAITFHRKKRSKNMVRSTLDNIEGLGQVKQKALIRHFGSLTQIKKATQEELQQVHGIGQSLATTIYAYFHEETPLNET